MMKNNKTNNKKKKKKKWLTLLKTIKSNGVSFKIIRQGTYITRQSLAKKGCNIFGVILKGSNKMDAHQMKENKGKCCTQTYCTEWKWVVVVISC